VREEVIVEDLSGMSIQASSAATTVPIDGNVAAPAE
jgi:hypothetical protein